MSDRSSTSDGSGRKVSRAAKLVVIGGLASGAAFAVVTGISSAAGTSGATKAATAATSSPAASSSPAAGPSASTTAPSGRPPRPGGLGGFGLGLGGFGVGFGGPGGAGTVTAINGTTLVLRTEAGTETVDTSSSTKFTKETQTVSLSAVKVGDVVSVVGPRPTSGSSASTPGTGTVTATRVVIVEPTFSGRVTAVSSGTLSLVGPEGQLFTVSTSGSTKYYSGSTVSSAAAIKVGSYVLAEGKQETITHLSADVINVSTAPTGGSRAGRWGPRGVVRGPSGPGPWSGAPSPSA